MSKRLNGKVALVTGSRPVAILYEHPEWFRPLFVELERREVPFERLHAAELTWDPASTTSPYGLVVNRMSPSAWTRGHAGAIFHTQHYLDHLESIGTPMINGPAAFDVELSKARQVGLMADASGEDDLSLQPTVASST
jgi:hypothetical protein